jgi:hypothetical protein
MGVSMMTSKPMNRALRVLANYVRFEVIAVIVGAVALLAYLTLHSS